MPGSRHLIAGKPGRVLTGYFDPQSTLAAGQSTMNDIINQPDGVRVTDIRLGANARANGIASTSGGQYYLVLGGSLVHEGREYGVLAMVHNEAGGAARTFAAGAKGASLLMLQFAPPSPRPGSDLALLAKRYPEYVEPEGLVDV